MQRPLSDMQVSTAVHQLPPSKNKKLALLLVTWASEAPCNRASCGVYLFRSYLQTVFNLQDLFCFLRKEKTQQNLWFSSSLITHHEIIINFHIIQETTAAWLNTWVNSKSDFFVSSKYFEWFVDL